MADGNRMKRLISLAFLVLVTTVFAGQTDLALTGPEGMTGSARVTNQVQDDGSKYVQLSMTMRQKGGADVSVLQESSYDAKGNPVRKLQVITFPGGGGKQTFIATFDEKGANVSVEAGGKTVTDTVPYPAGKSVRVVSEFWLIRDKPAPGAISTYWRFDIGTRKWEETKATYHGKRQLKIGAKTHNCHLVTVGEAKAYMDDNGDPLRVEQGGSVMERS